MKRISVLTSLFVMIAMIFSSTVIAAPLDEVKNLVRENYVGELPKNIDDYTSIQAIENDLDLYSTYFTKEEYERYHSSINNETIGIGVSIRAIDNGIEILEVFENAPADLAGLEAGDIVLAINGVSTKGMAAEQASSHITGKKGSQVELLIQKNSDILRTYIITRKSYSLPVVTKKLLAGDVGYISLRSYSDDGAKLVKEAKIALEKEGATSFILDLRNNGGGYVDTAEQLIGMFPRSQHAYTLKTRLGELLVPSVKQSSLFPSKTRVLINGASASASEMTAAALRDHQSALLYGQTTYGKGSMQGFYPISDGSYLKLTIATFNSPKGTVINERGVIPHVKTEQGKELTKAHLDSLVAGKKGYKKMKPLLQVAPDKDFTITFSGSIQLDKKAKVELIKLGESSSLPVKVKQISSNQLFVEPTNLLDNGAEYLLLVHPTISQSGKILETGAYVEVTVHP